MRESQCLTNGSHSTLPGRPTNRGPFERARSGRLFAAVLLLTVGLSAPVLAQAANRPTVDLFGGYSFLADEDSDFQGWNASATIHLKPWFGLVADFSGHHDSREIAFTLPGELTFRPLEIDRSINFFLFGGQFSFPVNRLKPFVRVMAGNARTSVSFDPNDVLAVSPLFVGVDAVTNQFALSGGGGLDVKIKGSLWIRIIQVDEIGIVSNGNLGSTTRLSTGVVFSF